VTDRLDAWLHGGDITRTSLARFRVLYAAILLLVLPDFSWITMFADSMYHPPPGPMQLFSGFPPEGVLRAFEAALAMCLVAILIGWHTRLASFVAVVVAMAGFGFTYGVGKIDHDILLVLIPAALAPAGWGDRLSLDAVRRRRRGGREPSERAEQWPLRLFGLLIGLAFLTAAYPKIKGGWLDLTTHAVQGYQARYHFTHGNDQLLMDAFLHVNSPVFWEAMDLATVALEAGMVLAVLSWRTTRLAFAIAATFHLGVWLMMNIPFVMNVMSYGFVVRWDRVPVPAAVRARAWRPSAGAVRGAPLLVVGGGLAWSFLIQWFGNARDLIYPVILFAGGLIGGGYLLLLLVRLVRSLRDGGDAVAGQLIYDADCGFCSRSARWLARRRPDRVHTRPAQDLPDLGALGLSRQDILQRAYWQGTSGELRAGSQAIAAALVARGGLPAVGVGRLIASPLVAPQAERVYRWVAAHRHRMPGSTDACQVPATAEPVDERPPSVGS
jgi:predicted DCC family thiol-disulfide oxidoreductase YuxK